MAKSKSTAVVAPNLGIYLDRPAFAMAPEMLQSGMNFRVQDGRYTNLNTGYTRFGTFQLNGPVVLIDNFFVRGLAEQLIFASLTDLYVYSTAGGGSVKYITPAYTTGTASASGTAVTGIGTAWNTSVGVGSSARLNVKVGDEISFGSATQNLPGATWFTVLSVNSDTSITLTASASSVGAGPYTIRQKFQGSYDNLWASEKFVNAAPENFDEWFATNGLDAVVRWNGQTTFATLLTSMGFTCKALRTYSNMMIYMNLNQGGTTKPTDIINSDVGQPSVTVGGLANQFRIHEGTDVILNAWKLADNLIIYCEQGHITVVQFVGSPIIFVFRQAVIDKGPLAARSIAQFPDHHEYLGRDSQYSFDGANLKPIGTHIWRQLLRLRDPARQRQIFTHRDPENGAQIWSIPFTGDPGSGAVSAPPVFAYTGHYLETVGQSSVLAGAKPQPHSARNFPFLCSGYFTRAAGITWDQLTNQWQSYNFRWTENFFAAQFPLNMVGDTNGKLYTINTSQDADGAALASFVRFGRRATIDGRMRGLVSRIYPFITTFVSPITVTARMADFATGPVTIIAAYTYDQSLPEGMYFVPVYRCGRFIEVEMGTAGPGQPWEVNGYDMDVRPGGKR